MDEDTDTKHLTTLESYINKGKNIDEFVNNRLSLMLDSLRIYDDKETKLKVICAIGRELDEVLDKIEQLETGRATTHFI